MSHSVSLVIDTGNGHTADVELRDVTYNNSVIFNAVGISIRDLDGRLCSDLVPQLSAAYDQMVFRRQELTELYRASGKPKDWGGYWDAHRFLEMLLLQCKNHPLARVSVS